MSCTVTRWLEGPMTGLRENEESYEVSSEVAIVELWAESSVTIWDKQMIRIKDKTGKDAHSLSQYLLFY